MVKVKDSRGAPRVFVYGTLKDTHSNNYLLKDAEFLGYDSVDVNGYLVNLGSIPAVIPDDTLDQEVRGEIYAIDEEILAALDLLEGHPTFYQRRKLVSNRLNLRVWVYHCVGLDVDEYISKEDHLETGIWHPTKEEREFWEKVA